MSNVPATEFLNINTSNPNTPSLHNKRRKRKNKSKNKNKPLNIKKKVFKRKPVNNPATKVVFTMSAWAEQFTVAATWQLKHQLAYWKAKAKSLEYENSVLHDIIRKNHQVGSTETNPGKSVSEDEKTEEQTELEFDESSVVVEEGKMGEWEESDGLPAPKMAAEPMDESEDSSDEKNIEVSEEFIQFLMVNAKHKEEIRLEKEKKRALEEATALEEKERKLKARRHYGLSAQELYGNKWQKIVALEMLMKSNFMSNSDSEKPALWPVIPFNFDFV